MLALVPSAKDGERTVAFLAAVGVECVPFHGLPALCDAFAREGGGAVLVTDEAIAGDQTGCLPHVLAAQPAWSAVPIVVLTRESAASRLEELLPLTASSVTLVELPLRARTLTSVVRAALRARRHQYDIRDAIEERERNTAALLAVTEASERQRRLYGTILGSTPDLVCVLDRDRRVTFANPALLEVWGVSLDEALGKPFGELGYERWHAEMHEREIDRVIASKEHLRGEAPFTGTGGRRIYDYIFVPVLDADGEVEAIACTCRDITARKESEAALAERAQLLRDADRRKDEFLATLAHELRNPLAPVRTGLEVLKRAPHEAAARRTREMMDRQVRHMVRLIDDLLDVSRITRGKIELQREPLTLSSVIDAAVESSRPLVEAGQHELRISLPAEPVRFAADGTRLAQVVSNLVNNAAKYSPSGGLIEVRAFVDHDHVVVEVRDNGVGIPPDKLDEVFEMFSQVNRTLDRAQGGLGIGLALVRRLVEMHGGTVSAASAGLNQGSTFTVRIPVGGSPPGAITARGRTGDVAAARGRRIMVVDDNVDAAESLAMYLELAGHRTRTAHSGPTAIAVALEFKPEVVFLDIGLPGMNGYEVAAQLRRQLSPAPAVLVAVTGWGTDEDKHRATAAGFDLHLTKPVDLSSIETVLAHLREHEHRAAAP